MKHAEKKMFQGGAAVVEFALVIMIAFLLLFGLIEFGRAMFKLNSAVDATRIGARTAAIVAIGDTDAVVASMNTVMQGELQAEDVTIEYSPDGEFPGAACVRGTCRFVRVSLDYRFYPGVFFLPSDIQLPRFSTTYPVEALGNL